MAVALDTPLITSFRQNPETSAGGKEALPLPMAVVVAFEWRARLAEAPRWDTLVLGAYLTMVWGGLRRSSLQRTSPGSLALDNHTLRGLTWRSKVSRLGQPFGLWTFGLSSRPPERGWGIFWFQCVSEWVRGLRQRVGPNVQVDHALPAIQGVKHWQNPCRFQGLK